MKMVICENSIELLKKWEKYLHPEVREVYKNQKHCPKKVQRETVKNAIKDYEHFTKSGDS